MLTSDEQSWFARKFPTLASFPAEKWAMIPLTFFVAIAVLMGIILPFVEVPKAPCDPCHDVQMKAYDEFLCTGKVGSTGAFEDQLAACRKKLGKPAAY
jgi:hypothetical protein